MVHRGDRLAPLGADLVDEDHERGGIFLLEPVTGRLSQDRWSKRTERLAMLDSSIEDVLHVRPSRVDDDRAVAERPRPELHPPLEPPDHVPAGYPPGDRRE